MSLTRSPCCHHLCFSDVAMCSWCGQAFEAGALERIAIAGEQSVKPQNSKSKSRPGKALGRFTAR